MIFGAAVLSLLSEAQVFPRQGTSFCLWPGRQFLLFAGASNRIQISDSTVLEVAFQQALRMSDWSRDVRLVRGHSHSSTLLPMLKALCFLALRKVWQDCRTVISFMMGALICHCTRCSKGRGACGLSLQRILDVRWIAAGDDDHEQSGRTGLAVMRFSKIAAFHLRTAGKGFICP